MNFPSPANFTFQPFPPANTEYLYCRCTTLAFKKREDFSRPRSWDWILGQTIHCEQTSIVRLPSKTLEIKELQIYNLVDPRTSTLCQSHNVGNCSRGFYRLATTSLSSEIFRNNGRFNTVDDISKNPSTTSIFVSPHLKMAMALQVSRSCT